MNSIRKAIRKIAPLRASTFADMREETNESLASMKLQIDTLNRRLEQDLAKIHNSTREIYWAEVFNQSIAGCDWLKDVSISPGRWAVGYPYLYVLFRVLTSCKPKRILELGLGQSTKVINAYAAHEKEVLHFAVDNNAEWITFHDEMYTGIEENHTKIIHLELEMIPFPPALEPVRAYSNFTDTFTQEKFDLISIDGPLGDDMPEIARIDILKILPDCLADSFAIMIDDSHRSGEDQMISLLKDKLAQAGIEFEVASYRGEKEVTIVCSPDNLYLCSL